MVFNFIYYYTTYIYMHKLAIYSLGIFHIYIPVIVLYSLKFVNYSFIGLVSCLFFIWISFH